MQNKDQQIKKLTTKELINQLENIRGTLTAIDVNVSELETYREAIKGVTSLITSLNTGIELSMEERLKAFQEQDRIYQIEDLQAVLDTREEYTDEVMAQLPSTWQDDVLYRYEKIRENDSSWREDLGDAIDEVAEKLGLFKE